MTEVWKACPGLPRYQVSSWGRVRLGGGDRIRRLKYDHRNYVFVGIMVRGRSENFHVAVLVCEAFNGPKPSPAHEVHHGNRMRSDNGPENLGWATKKQNLDQRIHPRGNLHHACKLTDDQVREARKIPRSEESDRRLAERFMVSREQIRDIRNMKERIYV